LFHNSRIKSLLGPNLQLDRTTYSIEGILFQTPRRNSRTWTGPPVGSLTRLRFPVDWFSHSQGLHGAALKVRVPLEAKTLDEIAKLPRFRSLAYPAPEQKVAPELKSVTESLSADVARFPVIISLFETDPKGAFAERLRAAGAEVGRYDPGYAAMRLLQCRNRCALSPA
jgi:hypothetical protein